MTTSAQIIELLEGRSLEVFAAAVAGTPVILCHGTPGCGMLADHWVAAGVAHGPACRLQPARIRRVLAPSGRTVADCVADVRTVAQALGAERVLVVGHSG